MVHDWLTGMRGGEYVLEGILEALKEQYPDAAIEIYTLLHKRGAVSQYIQSFNIHTSVLQWIPGIAETYRHFLPVMPLAVQTLDVGEADLIVSSSHCVAKGVDKHPDAWHVSYVHAPMRYMWDRFEDYFGAERSSPWVRFAARLLRPLLQAWDRRVSQPDRVDQLVANSRFIAAQIRSAYGRDSAVVHPFADLSRFTRPRRPEDFYLMVGAFAPNKRVDLAIDAFNRLKLPLKIVGGGQDETKLRSLAGPTVEFLGTRSNEEIAELWSRCKAFVFPGLEDFGITPVEAMAAGSPVIGYGRGGLAETVTAETGILFEEQSADALVTAVSRFESGAVRIAEAACRKRAAEFSRERFKREISPLLKRSVESR